MLLAVDMDQYRLAHPVHNQLHPSFIRARLEGNGLSPGDGNLQALVFYPPENVDTMSDGQITDYLIDTTLVRQNVPGRRT